MLFLSVPRVLLALSVFVGLTLATMANAADSFKLRPHVAINLASHHLNASRDFNQTNSGLGFGFTTPSGIGASEFGLEIGQYRNSVDRQSHYIMSSLDTEVAAITSSTALRLGVFAGFAHYPGDANKFRNSGVPTFGNWVLAAGGQATLRIDDTYDLRLRVMPAGKIADALFTLQLAIRF